VEPGDICWVDDCDRRAAASVPRDDLPGQLLLCATHTEDSRINGDRWTVTWDRSATSPSSVQPAPVRAVGREPSRSVDSPVTVVASGASQVKSRLSGWLRRRS
jgi:hypothetical protein